MKFERRPFLQFHYGIRRQIDDAIALQIRFDVFAKEVQVEKAAKQTWSVSACLQASLQDFGKLFGAFKHAWS